MTKKDIFPQFEVATCTIAVANTGVQIEVGFPNDLTDGEILELTDIMISLLAQTEMPVTLSEMSWEIDIGTRMGELAFTDPDLIYRISQAIQTTAARTAEHSSVAYDSTIHKKLTDGSGKGILVPAEKLFVGFDTNNYAGTPVAIVRIYYRIVKATDREVLEFLTSA